MKDKSIELNMDKLLMIQKGLEPKANMVLDKVAFDVEGIAKTLAPVLTGALRASIYVSGASGGSNYSSRASEAKSKAASKGKTIELLDEIKAEKMERIVGVGVVYGIFPEVNGKAYLVPAIEQVRPSFEKAWKVLFV